MKRQRTNWNETDAVRGASLLVSVIEDWGKVDCERLGKLGLQVKTMIRQIILAGFVVFLPAGVQAQGRGAMRAASHAVGVAPRAVTQAPRAGTAQALPGTRTVPRGGTVRPRLAVPGVRSTRPQITTQRRIDEGDRRFRPGCGLAPGLGFDAVHQAATCGSGPVGFGRGGFQGAGFFPFFDGGYSEPSSPGAVDEASAAQAPEPEATDAEARQTDRRYRAPEPAPTPAAESASSAPAENEQFVFVRRDGTVFFAVAYAWEKGTLRYVTSQGLRRTVTQDALDLDATRQFNEQRGLNFQLPA